jgi:hypothetical protein
MTMSVEMAIETMIKTMKLEIGVDWEGRSCWEELAARERVDS